MDEILNNYRTSVLNEGIEQGITRGRTEGREEEIARSICKLMRKNFSCLQAMDLLDIPEGERELYSAKAEAFLSSSSSLN